MRIVRLITFAALIFSLQAIHASAEKKEVARKKRTKADVTVVTSDRLTFDYKKRYALFEHNVMVTDPEMQLAADQLMITFNEDGDPLAIKAEGRVTITQSDKTAQAGVATYDLETGKIVLAKNPRVTRGRDILEGELITFWRDDNRMVCQPGARLVIHPEQDSDIKEQLLGD